MATMKEVEELTKKYADSREALSAAVQAHEDEKRALARRNLVRIKRLLETAKERKSELALALVDSAELFVKPRTKAFHGVRVGMRKLEDRLEYDAEQTVKLIRKHLEEDEFDRLVKTSYKPINDALAALPESVRKKIGVTLVPGEDEVTIKHTAGEIEKLVDALLAELPEEEVES